MGKATSAARETSSWGVTGRYVFRSEPLITSCMKSSSRCSRPHERANESLTVPVSAPYRNDDCARVHQSVRPPIVFADLKWVGECFSPLVIRRRMARTPGSEDCEERGGELAVCVVCLFDPH